MMGDLYTKPLPCLPQTEDGFTGVSVPTYRGTKPTEKVTTCHGEKHDQKSNKREILCHV